MAKKNTTNRRGDQPPPLLHLLEQARPYALDLVYRAGILPDLAIPEGTDDVDHAGEILDTWCRHVAHEATALVYSDGLGYDKDLDRARTEMACAAIDVRDAGYILGIAVGLLMRMPGGARCDDAP